jgi:hypothetical protein
VRLLLSLHPAGTLPSAFLAMHHVPVRMVGLGGLELPTKRLSAARAKRLSYGLAH